MASFDEINSKVLAMQREADQNRITKKRLEAKRTQLRESLDSLQNRRSSLDSEESDLKSEFDASTSDLDKLAASDKKRAAALTELEHDLVLARKQRNEELVTWWMETYPQFDKMSLSELEQWLEMAARQHSASGSDGGSGGKVRQHSVQDAKKLQAAKVATNSAADSATAGMMVGTEAGTNQSQSFADKQRVFINQDENDPIDTGVEAKDAEAIDSPLGNRDVNAEVDDYVKDHPDPKLDRKALTAHYQEELDL